jgi:hypothetical protein
MFESAALGTVTRCNVAEILREAGDQVYPVALRIWILSLVSLR